MQIKSVFSHGYALLIGVGADLPVTIADAISLHDILVDPERCAYPSEQVKLLTASQADRHGIIEGLNWLIAKAETDSEASALVYFSGHGGFNPEYHLVPFGYDAQQLHKTAVSGAEFTEKLRAVKAKKLLVLLDCCHAGGMVTLKTTGLEPSPVPPELSNILTHGSGRIVIASSRRDEVSYTGNPYSVFTQALREGFAGYGAAERDGYAYVADIAMYVGRIVPNRTKGKQHPILKLAAADNFALAYYAAGEKEPKPLADIQTLFPLVASIDENLLEGYRRILKRYQHNLLVVEDRMAQFIDQASVPLDLERTKDKILQKIIEIEATIEQQAKISN